jgi:hypothetical protein
MEVLTSKTPRMSSRRASTYFLAPFIFNSFADLTIPNDISKYGQNSFRYSWIGFNIQSSQSCFCPEMPVAFRIQLCSLYVESLHDEGESYNLHVLEN